MAECKSAPLTKEDNAMSAGTMENIGNALNVERRMEPTVSCDTALR